MIACTVSIACDRSPGKPVQPTTAMAIEQVIRQNVNVPVEQSITPIAAALSTRSIFVATDKALTTQPATVLLEKLRFKTALDNQGRLWAYAYTSQPEFSRAFPQGSRFIELGFRDFFGIVERDPRFAGIFLNAGSDASYPIPRTLFETVTKLLRPPDK
jgi:hypothetical protein